MRALRPAGARPAAGQDPFEQAEALASAIPLEPGARLLDLGCGSARSSIWFGSRGATVWAVDLAASPTENLARISTAGLADRVFPIRADARDLPFAEAYFDAAVAIDSFHYFGTDERFLPRLLQFIRPGGHVGIADVSFAREIRSVEDAPPYLAPTFGRHWAFVHSVEWWVRAWERTGLVEVVCAGPIPGSRRLLERYRREQASDGRRDEIARASAADSEELIQLFRLVARKR